MDDDYEYDVAIDNCVVCEEAIVYDDNRLEWVHAPGDVFFDHVALPPEDRR